MSDMMRVQRSEGGNFVRVVVTNEGAKSAKVYGRKMQTEFVTRVAESFGFTGEVFSVHGMRGVSNNGFTGMVGKERWETGNVQRERRWVTEEGTKS